MVTKYCPFTIILLLFCLVFLFYFIVQKRILYVLNTLCCIKIAVWDSIQISEYALTCKFFNYLIKQIKIIFWINPRCIFMLFLLDAKYEYLFLEELSAFTFFIFLWGKFRIGRFSTWRSFPAVFFPVSSFIWVKQLLLAHPQMKHGFLKTVRRRKFQVLARKTNHWPV